MHLSTTHNVNQCEPNTSQWVLPPTPTHMSLKTITPSPGVLPGGRCSSHFSLFVCTCIFLSLSHTPLCVCVYIFPKSPDMWPCVLTSHILSWVIQTPLVIFHSHQLIPAGAHANHPASHVLKPIWLVLTTHLT